MVCVCSCLLVSSLLDHSRRQAKTTGYSAALLHAITLLSPVDCPPCNRLNADPLVLYHEQGILVVPGCEPFTGCAILP
jgi:hypothetical protein